MIIPIGITFPQTISWTLSSFDPLQRGKATLTDLLLDNLTQACCSRCMLHTGTGDVDGGQVGYFMGCAGQGDYVFNPEP